MDHSMHGGMGSSHGGHDGGHGNHGSESTCNTNMLFTWDTTDMCVVFKWWHVRTQIGLILTLISIILLSAGYEYLRYRIRLVDNEASAASTLGNSPSVIDRRMRLKQAIGYSVQVGYSYLLMLIFMSYNGWAMVSVALGAGLGFWTWGDKAQRSMSCH